MAQCSSCGSNPPAGAKFCPQCGAPQAEATGGQDALIGQVIGNYRVLSIIGEGGMGKVYRAEQVKLRRPVCIKTLLPTFAKDPSVVARFEREGVSTAAMRHPNIVSVIDFGQTDGGVLYIVMEYVEGRTLRAILKEDAPVPVDRALGIMEQVLSGLDEAHALNVVHRDMKPSNILVSKLRDGTELVKVVDFGIAKIVGTVPSTEQLTRTGMMVGTPGYMSPEQILGKDVDLTTDIYSVGIMLWELITGLKLFNTRSEVELAQRHVIQAAPSPSSVSRVPLPAGLDEVVLKALEKSPDRRFRSALDFRRAIEALRGGRRSAPVDAATPMPMPTRSARPEHTNLGTVLPSLRGLVPEQLLSAAAALPALVASAERRQVTALFAELSGQAALGELIGSNEARALQRDALDAMAETVALREGSAERFMGTCLGAVFGFPTSHEDDPARCVEAALEMQKRVTALSARHPRALELRIGVHTGVSTGVVQGSLFEAPGLAEVLNGSRRLQASAKAGAILVSGGVERLTSKRVKYLAHPSVPGDTSGATFGVVGAIGESTAPQEPLCGRDAELAALTTIIDGVSARRSAGLLFVGGPGIGKTRLLAEATARARAKGITVATARAGRFGTIGVLDALRQLLSSLAGATHDAESRTTFAGLARVGVGPQVIARLDRLFGAPPRDVSLSGGFTRDDENHLDRAAMLLALEHAADRGPLLLVLDDLHACDAQSLEVLGELLTRAGKHPFGLVGAARPGESERLLTRVRRLELKPLSPPELRALLIQRLPGAAVPEAVVELIARRAEGNPHHALELVETLVETQALKREDGAWVIAKSEDVLPESLAQVLSARMARLSPHARLLLRYGAVAGRTFSLDLISAAVDTPLDVQAAAAECVQRQVLSLSEQSSGGYRFLQALTHEVVLNGLAATDRRHVHQRLAEAIERGVSAGGENPLEAMARHFLAAGQPRKAIKYLRLSGDRLLERNSFAPAIEAYQQCLALVQGEAARLGPLSEETGRHLLEVGSQTATALSMINPQEALKLLDSLLPQVPENHALVARGTALRQKGLVLLKLSRPVDAEKCLERAVELVATSDNPSLKALARADLAQAREARGELGGASTVLLEAMKLLGSPRLDDRNVVWQVLNQLGRIHLKMGRLEEAQSFFENARGQAKQSDSVLGESRAVANLAVLANTRKDGAQALALFDEASALAEQAGDALGVLRVRYNRARLLSLQARGPEAVKELEAVIEQARDLGWREGEALASQALQEGRAAAEKAPR